MLRSTARASASVWAQLQRESLDVVQANTRRYGFGLIHLVEQHILAHKNLADGLTACLTGRLSSGSIDYRQMMTTAYDDDPSIIDAAAADLKRTLELDPAANGLLPIFCFFKGFHCVQCARVAHHFWHRPQEGSRVLALAMQSEMSTAFGVDIHPASQWGSGITMDHAGGCVIGETAVIGDNVYLMHDVTLGATGTESSMDRHPKIGRGVFLAAKCTVLGNIEVGADAVVGAHALVNKPVPPGWTAYGVPAKMRPRDPSKNKVAPSGAPIPEDAPYDYGEGL